MSNTFFFVPGLFLIFGRLIGLEHATIKDNIVFGNTSPFDEARYQSVLDACALRQDLAIFDAGDMTGRYLSATALSCVDLFPVKKSERKALPCQEVSVLELH